MICTSKCFFVYLMYIFVRAYLQSITGCAYALYSTKYFLHIYGAIGTRMMFFWGDDNAQSILNMSVVPLLAIIQMFLYPVLPSGLVYCALASTIPMFTFALGVPSIVSLHHTSLTIIVFSSTSTDYSK